MEAGWPGAITAWASDPTYAPPDGESRSDVADRAEELLDEGFGRPA